MNVVVLLGAPGSGKGTLAAEMANAPGVAHLSTGDLLRNAVKAGTPVGQVAKKIMESGNLVPDDLIAQMVGDYLSAHAELSTVLLDGFPRNVAQAELLADLLAKQGVDLRCALLLDVPNEVVVRRLSGRRVCPGCGAGYNVDTLPPKREGICDSCGETLILRKDDMPETIRHRLDVYAEQTYPLIAYYRERGLLNVVDGSSDDLGAKVKVALEFIQ